MGSGAPSKTWAPPPQGLALPGPVTDAIPDKEVGVPRIAARATASTTLLL